MSKTWTAVSTIQKVPTDHNDPRVGRRPTTIASTVQSKPPASPPGLSYVDTSRTSVSKLRKSFEAVNQQEKEGDKPNPARRSTDIPAISVIQTTISPLPARTMDETKARPSLDALDEHTAGASPGEASIRPIFHTAFRLKNPVWDKNGGGSGFSSPGGQPRRSKRSQQASAKTSQSRLSNAPGKKNDPMEDDVSPTNSAPGTPRLMSPNLNATRQDPISPTKPPELYLSGIPISSSRDSEPAVSKKSEPHVQPKSKVAEPKGGINPKKHSAVPGDGPSHQITEHRTTKVSLPAAAQAQDTSTPRSSVAVEGAAARQQQIETEDPGVTATCALFSSPFRRESSTRPSPVRERIGIFEALVKPDPHSPHIDGSNDKKARRARPRSQPFLTGINVLDSKKSSTGWLPKPFRKMSLHLGKGKRHSEDKSGLSEHVNKGHDSGNQSTNHPEIGSNEAERNSHLASQRLSESVETDGKPPDQH